MHSLRSPLHIPFTYQVSCAPVGARHLPFTCFASHSLLPHSQLLHPPKPHLRCSLNSQSFLLGVCRCLLFLLACGSLRADRAVMFFAFPLVLSVASFQSFVPHSFNLATFSTARESSSFITLHISSLKLVWHWCFTYEFAFGRRVNLPNAIPSLQYNDLLKIRSSIFRFIQSLPLPLPTRKQKNTPALP